MYVGGTLSSSKEVGMGGCVRQTGEVLLEVEPNFTALLPSTRQIGTCRAVLTSLLLMPPGRERG